MAQKQENIHLYALPGMAQGVPCAPTAALPEEKYDQISEEAYLVGLVENSKDGIGNLKVTDTAPVLQDYENMAAVNKGK